MNCRNGVAEEIRIAGQPIRPDAVYEMATNDYIAWGGSGFNVLERNTTKIDTGISMRDAVIDYMKLHPSLPECFEPYDESEWEGATPEEKHQEYLARCSNGISVEDGRIWPVY